MFSLCNVSNTEDRNTWLHAQEKCQNTSKHIVYRLLSCVLLHSYDHLVSTPFPGKSRRTSRRLSVFWTFTDLNHKTFFPTRYTDNKLSMYVSQSFYHIRQLVQRGQFSWEFSSRVALWPKVILPFLSCINCSSVCERSHSTSTNSMRGFWRISHADFWQSEVKGHNKQVVRWFQSGLQERLQSVSVQQSFTVNWGSFYKGQ